MKPARYNPKTNTKSNAHESTPVLAAVVQGALISLLVAGAVLILVSIVLATTEWMRLGETGMLLVHYFSVATGSLLAAKKARHKGWLIGGLTGIIYVLAAASLGTMLGIPLAPLASIAQTALTAFIVGIVAGITGINM